MEKTLGCLFQNSHKFFRSILSIFLIMTQVSFPLYADGGVALMAPAVSPDESNNTATPQAIQESDTANAVPAIPAERFEDFMNTGPLSAADESEDEDFPVVTNGEEESENEDFPEVTNDSDAEESETSRVLIFPSTHHAGAQIQVDLESKGITVTYGTDSPALQGDFIIDDQFARAGKPVSLNAELAGKIAEVVDRTLHEFEVGFLNTTEFHVQYEYDSPGSEDFDPNADYGIFRVLAQEGPNHFNITRGKNTTYDAAGNLTYGAVSRNDDKYESMNFNFIDQTFDYLGDNTGERFKFFNVPHAGFLSSQLLDVLRPHASMLRDHVRAGGTLSTAVDAALENYTLTLSSSTGAVQKTLIVNIPGQRLYAFTGDQLTVSDNSVPTQPRALATITMTDGILPLDPAVFDHLINLLFSFYGNPLAQTPIRFEFGPDLGDTAFYYFHVGDESIGADFLEISRNEDSSITLEAFWPNPEGGPYYTVGIEGNQLSLITYSNNFREVFLLANVDVTGNVNVEVSRVALAAAQYHDMHQHLRQIHMDMRFDASLNLYVMRVVEPQNTGAPILYLNASGEVIRTEEAVIPPEELERRAAEARLAFVREHLGVQSFPYGIVEGTDSQGRKTLHVNKTNGAAGTQSMDFIFDNQNRIAVIQRNLFDSYFASTDTRINFYYPADGSPAYFTVLHGANNDRLLAHVEFEDPLPNAAALRAFILKQTEIERVTDPYVPAHTSGTLFKRLSDAPDIYRIETTGMPQHFFTVKLTESTNFAGQVSYAASIVSYDIRHAPNFALGGYEQLDFHFDFTPEPGRIDTITHFSIHFSTGAEIIQGKIIGGLGAPLLQTYLQNIDSALTYFGKSAPESGEFYVSDREAGFSNLNSVSHNLSLDSAGRITLYRIVDSQRNEVMAYGYGADGTFVIEKQHYNPNSQETLLRVSLPVPPDITRPAGIELIQAAERLLTFYNGAISNTTTVTAEYSGGDPYLGISFRVGDTEHGNYEYLDFSVDPVVQLNSFGSIAAYRDVYSVLLSDQAILSFPDRGGEVLRAALEGSFNKGTVDVMTSIFEFYGGRPMPEDRSVEISSENVLGLELYYAVIRTEDAEDSLRFSANPEIVINDFTHLVSGQPRILATFLNENDQKIIRVQKQTGSVLETIIQAAYADIPAMQAVQVLLAGAAQYNDILPSEASVVLTFEGVLYHLSVTVNDETKHFYFGVTPDGRDVVLKLVTNILPTPENLQRLIQISETGRRIAGNRLPADVLPAITENSFSFVNGGASYQLNFDANGQPVDSIYAADGRISLFEIQNGGEIEIVSASYNGRVNEALINALHTGAGFFGDDLQNEDAQAAIRLNAGQFILEITTPSSTKTLALDDQAQIVSYRVFTPESFTNDAASYLFEGGTLTVRNESYNFEGFDNTLVRIQLPAGELRSDVSGLIKAIDQLAIFYRMSIFTGNNIPEGAVVRLENSGNGYIFHVEGDEASDVIEMADTAEGIVITKFTRIENGAEIFRVDAISGQLSLVRQEAVVFTASLTGDFTRAAAEIMLTAAVFYGGQMPAGSSMDILFFNFFGGFFDVTVHGADFEDSFGFALTPAAELSHYSRSVNGQIVIDALFYSEIDPVTATSRNIVSVSKIVDSGVIELITAAYPGEASLQIVQILRAVAASYNDQVPPDAVVTLMLGAAPQVRITTADERRDIFFNDQGQIVRTEAVFTDPVTHYTYTYTSANRRLKITNDSTPAATLATITVPAAPLSFNVSDLNAAASHMLTFFGGSNLSVSVTYSQQNNEFTFSRTVPGGTERLRVAQGTDGQFLPAGFTRTDANNTVVFSGQFTGTTRTQVDVIFFRSNIRTTFHTTFFSSFTLQALEVIRAAALLSGGSDPVLTYLPESAEFRVDFATGTGQSTRFYYSAAGQFLRHELTRSFGQRSFVLSSTSSEVIVYGSANFDPATELTRIRLANVDMSYAVSALNATVIESFVSFYKATDLTGASIVLSQSGTGSQVFLTFAVTYANGDTSRLSYNRNDPRNPTFIHTSQGTTITLNYLIYDVPRRQEIGYRVYVQVGSGNVASLPMDIRFNVNPNTEKAVQALFDSVRFFQPAFAQDGLITINKVNGQDDYTSSMVSFAGSASPVLNFSTAGGFQASVTFQDSQLRQYTYSSDGTLIVQSSTTPRVEIFRTRLNNFTMPNTELLISLVNNLMALQNGQIPSGPLEVQTLANGNRLLSITVDGETTHLYFGTTPNGGSFFNSFRLAAGVELTAENLSSIISIMETGRRIAGSRLTAGIIPVISENSFSFGAGGTLYQLNFDANGQPVDSIYAANGQISLSTIVNGLEVGVLSASYEGPVDQTLISALRAGKEFFGSELEMDNAATAIRFDLAQNQFIFEVTLSSGNFEDDPFTTKTLTLDTAGKIISYKVFTSAVPGVSNAASYLFENGTLIVSNETFNAELVRIQLPKGELYSDISGLIAAIDQLAIFYSLSVFNGNTVPAHATLRLEYRSSIPNPDGYVFHAENTAGSDRLEIAPMADGAAITSYTRFENGIEIHSAELSGNQLSLIQQGTTLLTATLTGGFIREAVEAMRSTDAFYNGDVPGSVDISSEGISGFNTLNVNVHADGAEDSLGFVADLFTDNPGPVLRDYTHIVNSQPRVVATFLSEDGQNSIRMQRQNGNASETIIEAAYADAPTAQAVQALLAGVEFFGGQVPADATESELLFDAGTNMFTLNVDASAGENEISTVRTLNIDAQGQIVNYRVLVSGPDGMKSYLFLSSGTVIVRDESAPNGGREILRFNRPEGDIQEAADRLMQAADALRSFYSQNVPTPLRVEYNAENIDLGIYFYVGNENQEFDYFEFITDPEVSLARIVHIANHHEIYRVDLLSPQSLTLVSYGLQAGQQTSVGFTLPAGAAITPALLAMLNKIAPLHAGGNAVIAAITPSVTTTELRVSAPTAYIITFDTATGNLRNLKFTRPQGTTTFTLPAGAAFSPALLVALQQAAVIQTGSISITNPPLSDTGALTLNFTSGTYTYYVMIRTSEPTPVLQRIFKINGQNIQILNGTLGTQATAALPLNTVVNNTLLAALDQTAPFHQGGSLTISSVPSTVGTTFMLQVQSSTANYSIAFNITPAGLTLKDITFTRTQGTATFTLPLNTTFSPALLVALKQAATIQSGTMAVTDASLSDAGALTLNFTSGIYTYYVMIRTSGATPVLQRIFKKNGQNIQILDSTLGTQAAAALPSGTTINNTLLSALDQMAPLHQGGTLTISSAPSTVGTTFTLQVQSSTANYSIAFFISATGLTLKDITFTRPQGTTAFMLPANPAFSPALLAALQQAATIQTGFITITNPPLSDAGALTLNFTSGTYTYYVMIRASGATPVLQRIFKKNGQNIQILDSTLGMQATAALPSGTTVNNTLLAALDQIAPLHQGGTLTISSAPSTVGTTFTLQVQSSIANYSIAFNITSTGLTFKDIKFTRTQGTTTFTLPAGTAFSPALLVALQQASTIQTGSIVVAGTTSDTGALTLNFTSGTYTYYVMIRTSGPTPVLQRIFKKNGQNIQILNSALGTQATAALASGTTVNNTLLAALDQMAPLHQGGNLTISSLPSTAGNIFTLQVQSSAANYSIAFNITPTGLTFKDIKFTGAQGTTTLTLPANTTFSANLLTALKQTAAFYQSGSVTIDAISGANTALELTTHIAGSNRILKLTYNTTGAAPGLLRIEKTAPSPYRKIVVNSTTTTTNRISVFSSSTSTTPLPQYNNVSVPNPLTLAYLLSNQIIT